MGSVRHADDETAASGATFFDVGRRVANLGDVMRLVDAGELHRTLNQVGMGPALLDLVARHGDVHDAASPLEAREEHIQNLAAESGVERNPNPGVVKLL